MRTVRIRAINTDEEHSICACWCSRQGAIIQAYPYWQNPSNTECCCSIADYILTEIKTEKLIARHGQIRFGDIPYSQRSDDNINPFAYRITSGICRSKLKSAILNGCWRATQNTIAQRQSCRSCARCLGYSRAPGHITIQV